MAMKEIREALAKKGESTESPKPEHPIKEAVEKSIVKQLDREAREDAALHTDAVVDREPTITKISSYEFYEKVASAVDHLRFDKKRKSFTR